MSRRERAGWSSRLFRGRGDDGVVIEPCDPGFYDRYQIDDPVAPEDRRVWEVLERDDSVAVLVFAPETEEVLVLERFRAGAKVAEPEADGRIFETVAGRLAPDVDALSAAQALIADKTPCGRLVETAFERICVFYPSPGACAERIHLFFVVSPIPRDVATATEADAPEDAALSPAAERPRLRRIGCADFFKWLEAQSLGWSDGAEAKTARPPERPPHAVDVKLTLAAQHLQDVLRRKRAREAASLRARGDRFQPQWFRHPAFDARIVLHRGDIGDVRGVDVWVSSENTLFEMDQRLGRSVSGRIRGLGAHVDRDEQPIEDTIWIDLLRARGEALSAAPVETIVETSPGNLFATNDVKRLLHLASVEASVDGVRSARLIDISRAVRSALTRVDGRDQRRGRTRSILFPMIGAGVGGAPVRDVFTQMLDGVRDHFAAVAATRRSTGLEAVHFVAYDADDHRVCAAVLSAQASETAPLRAWDGAGDDVDA